MLTRLRAILCLLALACPALAIDTKIDRIVPVSGKSTVEISKPLVFESSAAPTVAGQKVALFNDAGTLKIKTASTTITIGSGGGGAWGSITGTLSDQTDLQTALDAKVPTTRTVNGYALSSNVTLTKSDLSLGSVENTALSTWAGSTNLTTLGTIGTGTWNGTTIAVANGGTGQATAQAAINALMAASGALSQGDVFYYNGTNIVRLAAGTSGQFLKTNGAAANPAWATPPGSATTFLGLTDTPADYTGAAGMVATVNATETGLEFVSFGATYLVGANNLSDLTDIPTAQANLLLGSAATLNASDVGAGVADIGKVLQVNDSGQVKIGNTLIVRDAGLDPGDTVEIQLHNDDNVGVAQIRSANLTAARVFQHPDNAGTYVTTGDTGSVTNAMLAGSIANAKLSNSSVTINGTAISLGASGTVTAAAGTLTGTSLNSSVVTSSLTSVGTIATGTWNGTTIAVANGGTGQTTAQAAINSLMAASGALSQGDVFYYNGTNVVRLAAGTSGQFLKTNGAAANPSWAAAGGNVAADAIFDAKGDLAVGTGADTAARLAVGTNGQVLTADSAETTGLKWSAAGAGDVIAANVNTFTGAYNTFNGTASGGSGVVVITGTTGGATGKPILHVDNPNSDDPVAIFKLGGTAVFTIGATGQLTATETCSFATTANTAVKIGGGASVSTLNLFEASGNGSNHIDISPPASLGGNRTFTLPDVSGTAVTTGDTGTVSNTMLANSSITIAGTATALGGTITLDTITGLSSTGIVKRTGANTYAIATSGTDYLVTPRKTLRSFTPIEDQPPAANYATLGTRNGIATLLFDKDTDEAAVFLITVPNDAVLTSGLKLIVKWTAPTATTGDAIFGVQFERMNTDEDADSFDTAATTTTTTNGTSGIVNTTTITNTNIDSVAAGDGLRIKLYRDADAVGDTLAEDAEVIIVELQTAN